ncbi:unnamed protein product [Urochloa decumbens]|uniref:Knottins-like domain-containing protein n=1 Tax=Urochloa decumbens TaxID=240449 RepID=A0ABC9AVU1_9POAL
MAPSGRKNLSAAPTVFLLLVIVTAEMASVACNTCRHLSGNFRGWCFDRDGCTETCIHESNDNISGECHDFPLRCYCITNCSP